MKACERHTTPVLYEERSNYVYTAISLVSPLLYETNYPPLEGNTVKADVTLIVGRYEEGSGWVDECVSLRSAVELRPQRTSSAGDVATDARAGIH